MNELINELLKQSRTEYWTQYTPSYDYEKFAELIVRECLNVINQPNGVGDDDVIRISDDVKRHFGVE
jgi:hypothetical protein